MKPRVALRKYRFDHVAFRCAVADAFATLETTQTEVCRELGLDAPALSAMLNNKRGGGSNAHPLIMLCAHIGIDPREFLVDTDALGEQPPMPKTYREAVLRVIALEKELRTLSTTPTLKD